MSELKPATTGMGSVTYKEAATKHLQVALIDHSNLLGKLTEAQKDIVETHLNQALEEPSRWLKKRQ